MPEYKLSQFTVCRDLQNGTGIMLFNTLTSGGLATAPPILDALRKRDWRKVPPELQKVLVENGLVVPAHENETATYWSFYQRMKSRSAFDELHVVVLPTYKCNLRCTYCFEDNKRLESIDRNRIDPARLLNWVRRQHKAFRFTKLGIVFYGGEPLLYRSVLLKCIRMLARWCRKTGVRFHFSLVTNGSLLRKDILLTLLRYGLREVQVTIDGPEKIHDARRPFKNGKGSYQVIKKNLRAAARLPIKIIVRVNIDRHNRRATAALVRELRAAGLSPGEKLTFATGLVDPSPMKRSWNRKFVPQTFRERLRFMREVKEQVSDAIQDPQVLLKEHKVEFGLCHAKIDNYVIIGPDGMFYNCYSLIGYPDGVCGDLDAGLNQRFSEFMYFCDQRVAKCLAEGCPFTPICNGGCFYQSHIEKGNFLERVCQRRYFENIWLPLKASIYQNVMKQKESASAQQGT